PEFVSGESYAAPTNRLEQRLSNIWQMVLGLDRVGINDNFFSIGGHSISAIRLTSAIGQTLNLDVPLALLFKHQTVATLAAHMGAEAPIVIPHVECERYPLSFAQQRMLFIEQFEQGFDAYHIPYLVQLTANADLAALEVAFNVVANRHPVLKSIYPNDGFQYILTTDVVLQSKQIDAIQLIAQDIKRPFDLTTEPGLRLHHYQLGQQHYLLMLCHHIAFDGWSVDIMLQALAHAYHSDSNLPELNLPELNINYGDYALWQRETLQGEYLDELLSFWRNQLADVATLALPVDHPRPAKIDYRGRDVAISIDADLSKKLRLMAKSQQTTLCTVMLSAFYVTLAKLSGQTDIVVGTPSDNRQYHQTQALIGLFVNSLVLRTQVDPQLSIERLIKLVHRDVTEAKVHQELPFEQLVDTLALERDTSRHPIYQVLFSLQRFGDKVAESLP
ncbi:MAG: condensation domain-containing protein, partial [Psychrosphaera sp.]|nr:condensation domain-containing protein [Psychrosphaera sp.]